MSVENVKYHFINLIGGSERTNIGDAFAKIEEKTRLKEKTLRSINVETARFCGRNAFLANLMH